jgi:hypothetical protein
MVPPRNITITTPTDAAIDAVDVVITGQVRGPDGTLEDVTDTITLTDGGGATDAGTIPFSLVTQVDIPAQSGVAAGMTIGFGVLIGLSDLMNERAGYLGPLREVAAGSVVTNGTFNNPSGSPVTTYSPNAAADGSRDYAVTYEVA